MAGRIRRKKGREEKRYGIGRNKREESSKKISMKPDELVGKKNYKEGRSTKKEEQPRKKLGKKNS